jgi:3-dehydroquinate synthase
MSDNILFTADPGKALGSFLAEHQYSSVAVLVDQNSALHCYPLIQNNLPPHHVIAVPAGEEFKQLGTCEKIWQKLTDLHMDRHSVLIILGGGVLGDMGGFCAATYKRGVDFVLVPTTLLSLVDSSIGGKLAIDFHHLKNHIGVFQLPALTLLYSGFVTTLPYLEQRSGFAEVIKHALISDRPTWDAIRKVALKDQPWSHLIEHSVNFKAGVVQEDPKEKGLRKILNTGHTIGHGIETHLLNENRKVMHGEAVAAGIIAESWIASQRKDLLTQNELNEICDYLLRVFGKIDLREADFEKVAALTLQDKKNRGNRILCVLLERIGKPVIDREITLEEVKRALQFYSQLQI